MEKKLSKKSMKVLMKESSDWDKSFFRSMSKIERTREDCKKMTAFVRAVSTSCIWSAKVVSLFQLLV